MTEIKKGNENNIDLDNMMNDEENLDDFLTNLENELKSQEHMCILINGDQNVEFAHEKLCKLLGQAEDEVNNINIENILPEVQNIKADNPAKLFTVEDQLDYSSIEGFTKQNIKMALQYRHEVRKYESNEVEEKQSILWIREQVDESLLIQPSGTKQLIWNILMMFFIILIVFYLPQQLSFMKTENPFIDQSIDIFFYCDIILSFNVAYKDEEDKLITDRCKIVVNQVTGWLVFDIIASFPQTDVINLFANELAFDPGFLNMLRFVRFFRLIKIFKSLDTNLYTKLILKNQYGREFVSWLRDNIGLWEILKCVISLLVLTHFFSVFWQLIEFLNQDSDNSWLRKSNRNYQDLFVNDPESLQFVMQQQLISTALGFGRLEVQEQSEKIFALIWMITGTFYYCQVIGNISSYVSQLNLKNFEQDSQMKVVEKLSYENRISDDTLKKISEAIIANKEKFDKKSVDELKPQISIETFNMLRKEMLTTFISKFIFFNKLSLASIALIKEHSQHKTDSSVYKINANAAEIQFITKGIVQLFDSHMNMVGNQETNDILGQNELTTQLEQKKEGDVFGDDKGIKDKKAVATEGNSSKLIQRSNQAIAKENTEQLLVPFSVIEEIKEIESTFLQKLGEHVKNQSKFISIIDQQNNQEWLQNEFEEMKAACIINNEYFFKTNRKFDDLVFSGSDETVGNITFTKQLLTENKTKWGSALELINGRAILDGVSDEYVIDMNVDTCNIVTKNDKVEVQYQYEKVNFILVTVDVVSKTAKIKNKNDISIIK